jgi:hypothetical protein
MLGVLKSCEVIMAFVSDNKLSESYDFKWICCLILMGFVFCEASWYCGLWRLGYVVRCVVEVDNSLL